MWQARVCTLDRFFFFAKRDVYMPRQHIRLSTYGRRAFAIAGPSARNSLPDPVRNANATEAAFRSLLQAIKYSRGTSAVSAFYSVKLHLVAIILMIFPILN